MHVAIGSVVRRLGSVVIRSTFGVLMHVLYLGGVHGYGTHAGYAPAPPGNFLHSLGRIACNFKGSFIAANHPQHC